MEEGKLTPCYLTSERVSPSSMHQTTTGPQEHAAPRLPAPPPPRPVPSPTPPADPVR